MKVKSQVPSQEVVVCFRALADEWERETRFSSMVHEMVMHSAYQQIIGLGPVALPLIFKELEAKGDWWFWALTAITGEDVAKGTDTFDGARQMWLDWGRKYGYLDSPD